MSERVRKKERWIERERELEFPAGTNE